jgi:methyl-accepting chemotaxis protein
MQAVLRVPYEFALLGAAHRARILLAFFVIIATVISGEGLVSVRQAQLEARKAELQHMVEASINSIQYYYDQYKSGLITEAQAKFSAFSMLNQMTYNHGQNYVFAYSYEHEGEAILRMHPLRPDVIGTNRWDSHDRNGVYYDQELIAAAKNGGGFVAYLWDGGIPTATPRAKISYGAAFAPWSLMVGTGQYVDDIITEFWERLSFLFSMSALCLATGTTFLTWLLGGRRERLAR